MTLGSPLDAPRNRRSALRVIGGAAASAGLLAKGTSAYAANGLSILDEKQLGQLSFIDQLSRQLPSDWAYMGSAEPGQGGFDAYRYQLAMMSYTLALAQYHYTPAWLDQPAALSRRLLDKMMQFDVWGFWELTSRGARMTEPGLAALRESQIDPVRLQNIMYSGHLFQMVTTHHMLFNDRSFEQPGSIQFDYNPVARGLGRQTFDYDVHSLANVLVEQFRINRWRGIECEPNAIFPECNQHPLLGFKLYDTRYGGDRFRQISSRFREQYDNLGYLDRKSGSVMAFFLVKEEKVIRQDRAWSDGWTGTFLHAWDRREPEGTYPLQRARFLTRLQDGTATIHAGENDHDYSHGHGFLAALAAEVGDVETRDAMLAYADTYWSPVWDGPSLRYPRSDIYRQPGDAANILRRVQPLTGNGLIGLARLGGRDRLYKMFAQPLDARHFQRTRLAGVDYPAVQVAGAAHDDAGTLHIELRAGRGLKQGKDATFRIEGADLQHGGALIRDGKPFLVVDGGRLQPSSGIAGDGRIDANGAIVVSASLSRGGNSFQWREKETGLRAA